MAQLSDLKTGYLQLSNTERMELNLAIRLSRRTPKARVNGKKPKANGSTPRVARAKKTPQDLFANMTPEQIAAILAALGGDE